MVIVPKGSYYYTMYTNMTNDYWNGSGAVNVVSEWKNSFLATHEVTHRAIEIRA